MVLDGFRGSRDVQEKRAEIAQEPLAEVNTAVAQIFAAVGYSGTVEAVALVSSDHLIVREQS